MAQPSRVRLLANLPADELIDAAVSRCIAEMGTVYPGEIPDQALEATVSHFTERLLHAVDAMHAPPATETANDDDD